MARWYDQRPGSNESLLALYDAVGAAEEFDLAQQAADDALRAEFDWLPDDDTEIDEGPTDVSPESDDADRLTMARAVGIVQHLLGGRKLDA